jgi:putative membrane protein
LPSSPSQLSSTSSERTTNNRSATEVLASRYRHLFVLPSGPRLLFYGGFASFLLSILSKGTAGLTTFIVILVVFVLSASAISSAMAVVDKSTIATFRRVLALLAASVILWLIIAAVGWVYALVSGSGTSLPNSLLFGAFVCAGFEFLVINGAFDRSAPRSLIFAAIHPVATILVLREPGLAQDLDPVAVTAGVIAFVTIAAFTVFLGRRKTSSGHDALSLFQAFMKTWTSGNSDELEGMISDHAEEAEVTTKVIRLRTKNGDTFLVLPGVHPGPFHPVGSYDLPGVVSRAFKEMGPVMTLHRPGGHERNLVTRKETSDYVQRVKEMASSMPLGQALGALRGPFSSQIGNAKVGVCAFAGDMVMTISFSPLGSDDIDTRVEGELAKPASESGFDLSIVDAHNSIDPDLQTPATGDPGWKQMFEAAGRLELKGFEAAYCHSSEVGFVGHGDLTENGMGLLMLRVGTSKHVLILADANNSVSGLRAEVAAGLESAGYNMIEFCTSDSHNLAARGLSAERGYQALGEATPTASITSATVEMAKRAETRLSPAEYASSKAKSRVRVFGSKALEEFASFTQSSSRFSRSYFRAASAVLVLLLVTAAVF